MTSQVNPNNIDGTYPVAGQDNDSQGFRDNFTNIRNNFTFIKAEVEDLQSKAVLKSALTNTTLDNDFAGNAISNATLTSWRETYYNAGSVSGAWTINFTNGNQQKITLNGSTTLTFSWPSGSSGSYLSVKLWVSNSDSTRTLSFANAPSLGDADTVAGYNAGTITFSAAEISNNTDYFFEIFTFDGGSTLGIRDLIRNRDVDLSGMSITGNLTLDGLTVTTYKSSISSNVTLGASINDSVGSNVVVVSNANAVSTSTGALVSKGGVGITGNIFASGNINGGSFVPTSTSIPTVGIYSGGSNIIGFATANAERWYINASGTFLPVSDNTLDIGNGVANPRDLNLSRNAIVAGNTRTAGNTITVGGKINSNYLLANVVTGQNLFANVNYNRFIANCSPTGTVANLFITLPNSVEDGREIDITSMTAITSCFVSNMTPGVASVYGLANTWAASASLTNSVSIKLMYNASVGRWFNVG